jgi:hypothetical protein
MEDAEEKVKKVEELFAAVLEAAGWHVEQGAVRLLAEAAFYELGATVEETEVTPKGE